MKLTEKEYRANPAISRSELWRIKESPEKFLHYRNNPQPPTPALVFGQALHKAVLEPDSFSTEFAVAPQIDRRTKAGKAEYEEFCAESAGKTILTADIMQTVQEMTAKINNHDFSRLLLSGEHEVPYFWTDELTGEPCKCRADCVTEINGIVYIIDLKTCETAETTEFMKKSVDYGYHVQTAMYTDGVQANINKKCEFVFIAIEKKPPYSINIMQTSPIFSQYGYDEYRHLLGIYHECKTTDNWYGYLGKFNEINSLGIPAWIAKEYQKEG